MYILTPSGVTAFANDWAEREGIEHLANCHLPEGTECWSFSDEEYEAMGSPPFEALEPDGTPDFVTIGKPAWKLVHPELFDDYIAPVAEEEIKDASEAESI